MDKVHTYKDHTITLAAEKKESGWVCKYSVSPLDPQNTRSYADYTPANFATEEEAEQIALRKAQTRIDSTPGR